MAFRVCNTMGFWALFRQVWGHCFAYIWSPGRANGLELLCQAVNLPFLFLPIPSKGTKPGLVCPKIDRGSSRAPESPQTISRNCLNLSSWVEAGGREQQRQRCYLCIVELPCRQKVDLSTAIQKCACVHICVFVYMYTDIYKSTHVVMMTMIMIRNVTAINLIIMIVICSDHNNIGYMLSEAEHALTNVQASTTESWPSLRCHLRTSSSFGPQTKTVKGTDVDLESRNHAYHRADATRIEHEPGLFSCLVGLTS